MIYLDNAATSFPKPRSVTRAVDRCIRKYCGNPGRSSHVLSVKASEKIYAAREELASFLGIKSPERIVFTQNATHALNFAIKGLIDGECNCMISDIEHNSVIRPLHAHLEGLGGSISVFRSEDVAKGELTKYLGHKTRYLICNHVSNVTGFEIDLRIISDFCKKNGIKLILDLSQSIGHKEINLSDIDFAAACAPGHKGLMGIQGSGFVVFRGGENPMTLLEGGSGNKSTRVYMPDALPERLEAGTLNTPAIVSLLEGVRYIKRYGVNCIDTRISLLTYKLNEILNSVKGIKVYGCQNGIASFNIRDLDSEYVAGLLSDEGICVRGGLHCAPLIHANLGTLNQGTVRVSLSHFNTYRDLDVLYKSLKNIVK